MAIYQILVRNLDGKTQCLRFASPEVSCEDVKELVAARDGVPGDLQRLVTGTRELESGRVLVAGADGFFPSCTLSLRLRGGKGGFGSLLRGAATKAGQKKTSNFDACRDMSGRRLRHVNAEKKLKEWKADAKERELEKTAEDFLKKHKKTEEEDKGLEEELENFRKQSLLGRTDIESAVTDGLVEARKLHANLKRKKVEALESEKKPRTWSPNDLDEADDDEDDEDDSDKEDAVGPSSSDKDVPSASTSDNDEASPSCATKDEAGSSASDEVANLSRKVYAQASRETTIHQSSASEAVEVTITYSEVSRNSPVSSSDNEAINKVAEEPTISNRQSENPVSSTTGGDMEASADHLVNSKLKDMTGPLDFEDYNTSKHLEVLGLERLKTELQGRGLKCGGSLSERAARLFLLKTTPLEMLDKSHFSKPTRKAGRK